MLKIAICFLFLISTFGVHSEEVKYTSLSNPNLVLDLQNRKFYEADAIGQLKICGDGTIECFSIESEIFINTSHLLSSGKIGSHDFDMEYKLLVFPNQVRISIFGKNVTLSKIKVLEADTNLGVATYYLSATNGLVAFSTQKGDYFLSGKCGIFSQACEG